MVVINVKRAKNDRKYVFSEIGGIIPFLGEQKYLGQYATLACCQLQEDVHLPAHLVPGVSRSTMKNVFPLRMTIYITVTQ
jgi:hypothetical protein